jgi:hypothetical protein
MNPPNTPFQTFVYGTPSEIDDQLEARVSFEDTNLKGHNSKFKTYAWLEAGAVVAAKVFLPDFMDHLVAYPLFADLVVRNAPVAIHAIKAGKEALTEIGSYSGIAGYLRSALGK